MNNHKYLKEWVDGVCRLEKQFAGKELTAGEFAKRWKLCGGDITIFKIPYPKNTF